MENDPLIGRQLGAYLIQGKLGEGGMARVYKGYHARLRRAVAIKVILSQIADKADFQARFEQEAQLIAKLQHPHIVTVYDFGESGNLTYLVMQYVGGGTLRNQLHPGRPVELRVAAQYALQMARALHHAHLYGIVHRDVKPQNMLVSALESNELLLSDFGIAKLFTSKEELTVLPSGLGGLVGDHSLTNVGQMVGTAEYMAPEQVNVKPVDARTDVYALGVVLFQMLTGQVPFQSSSQVGLLYQQVHAIPPSVRELNPAVPERLAQITAKALAKVPEARFQSAEAMAQALEAVVLAPTGDVSGGDYTTELAGPSNTIVSYPYQRSLTPPASSGYGQQSISGAATPETPLRATTAGRGKLVARRKKFPLSYIMIGIVVALLIVFGTLHPMIPGLSGGTSPITQPKTIATAFTEDFQNNQRGWIATSMNGLTASSPSNGTYMLATDGSVTTLGYLFPHPDPTAVGTLPETFTLTVLMAQNAGDVSAFHGLVFRFREESNNVYSYAFVINGQGEYRVWKFDPNAPVKPTPLWSGSHLAAIHSGLKQSNTLVAIIQGSSFSFKVNDMAVPLNGGNQSITDSSSPYTGGQLALLVSGSNSQYAVSRVQLAIP